MTTSTSEKILNALIWAKNCLADFPHMRPVVKELESCLPLVQNAVILSESEQNTLCDIYRNDPNIFLGDLSDFLSFINREGDN
jgi:hypothetical protein